MRLARAVRRVLAAAPAARAVVPVPTRAAVGYWIGRLDGWVGRPVYDADAQDRHWGPEPRVTVVCESLFRACGEEDFDLVVVPDAGRLLRSAVRVEPIEERQIPAVGFLAAGTRLRGYEQLRAEALFGGVVAPAASISRAVIAVLAVTAPSPVRAGGRRARVWGHRDRNRRVAAAANAYRRDDRSALCDLGLPSLWSPAARVAVLVESVEHADLLAPGLPGWRRLAGDCDVDATGRNIILAAAVLFPRVGLLDWAAFAAFFAGRRAAFGADSSDSIFAAR